MVPMSKRSSVVAASIYVVIAERIRNKEQRGTINGGKICQFSTSLGATRNYSVIVHL